MSDRKNGLADGGSDLTDGGLESHFLAIPNLPASSSTKPPKKMYLKATSTSSKKTSNLNRLNDPEVRLEEKLKKKAFAHYDCQSMTANLNYANGVRNILNKRRNTTTGASAASMVGKESGTPGQESDSGDGRSNNLVLSCPFFRNELGGEEERMICLNRRTSEKPAVQCPSPSDSSSSSSCVYLHCPYMASGLTLLEDANDSRWKSKGCPYQQLTTDDKSFICENYDIGASYYRKHFRGLEHQNWFGTDDNLGPIAISIRRERVNCSLNDASEGDNHTTYGSHKESSQSGNNQIKHQYRLIIRTSDLSVMRGTVFEDCIPVLASSRHNNHNNHHAKEVLEYITPELNLSNLRLGASNADEQLLKLDEQVITRTYKVGVIYCGNGQGTEEEMYNNEHASPAFEEFLSCLGEKVRLKGFDKYRAGLDNKTDTTGLYSLYSTYNDCEIMFHVSTLLPYTPNNKQQLLRKRHIGNDIVTIVFQESNAHPFTPMNIRSHFQHVFIIVRTIPPEPGDNSGGETRYAISVARSKEVPVFGPPIPAENVFTKSKTFTEFLLAKIINGENAAHKSEKFSSMAQRTRYGYLKDLATNYITNTSLSDVSCGNSASAKLVSTIFGSSRKKGSNRGRDSHFIGKSVIKGAIVWEMSVEDFGQSKLVDCLVGISCDTFIIIEESTKQTLFACPNTAILGWTSHPSFIKIFYHQGECILLKCKDPDLDEIAEIVTRLRAVTSGCETQELILRRNSLGQLGFHIEPDGIVKNVENFAFAWQAGLRRNCRIVEICKVAIATLNYDQMIDLLKTSMTVTITILSPHQDGSPKRGCNLTECPYLSSITYGARGSPSLSKGLGIGGDYENIGIIVDLKKIHLANGRNSSLRSPNSPTPSKNSVGLPLGTYPVPLSTSHSSKSLTISNNPAADGSFQKITPSSSSSNIYSNLGCPRAHRSPQSFIGLPHFSNNNSKREIIRPKSTTNECSTLSTLNSGLISPPKETNPLGRVHEHMAVHCLGNVMLSRSELSLNSKDCYQICGSDNPSNPSINQSETVSDILPSSSPSSSSSSTHRMPYSAHRFNPKINENTLHCGLPPYTQQQQSLSSSTSSYSNPPQNKGQGGSKNGKKDSGAGSWSDWSADTGSWSSPLMGRRVQESSASNNSCNGTALKSHLSANPPFCSPSSSISSNRGGIAGSDLLSNHRVIKQSSRNQQSQFNYNPRSNSLSNRIKVRNGSHKNGSASSGSSASTSTLQEDLLKLLNPDYMMQTNTGDCESNSNTSGGETSTSQYSTPYSSLERSSTKEIPFKDPGQVILTVAQPAQVIFSQPSSPSDSLRGKETSSTPNSSLSRSHSIAYLPQSQSSPSSSVSFGISGERALHNNNNVNSSSPEEDGNIDWPTLVDTATKAIAHNNSESLCGGEERRGSNPTTALDHWLREFGASVVSSNGLATFKNQRVGENMKDLEETVKKLQFDLVREQNDKANLLEQMKSLKEENIRLVEESKTAAAQLRKFTEWFFQNINPR
ncbi:uncharacterized protein LOC141853749 [Brevipalpus obovatus]|uniref:uncharacterized protein LOC141853749 n=1 Tax=Brevipalpus obovatus TaxID=246614 RepID=UPI003D9E6608